MRPSIFLLCSGLGFGNASRVVAVLQALRARPEGRSIAVRVFSWGKALSLLSAYATELQFELVELFPYQVRGSGPVGALVAIPRAVLAYIRNTRIIGQALRKHRPGLALLDSDYHFLPFLTAGVSVISLGQASDVLLRQGKLRSVRTSWKTWASLVLFEKLDAWVQRKFSRFVLVPSFELGQAAGRKVRPIPLIVRREFLSRRDESSALQDFCVILSGSGIASGPLLKFAHESGIPVFGPGEDRSIQPVVNQGAPCIDRFRAVITQGGLSSISECLARKKPLFVLPIRDHAEQKLNALEIQSSGYGEELSERDLNLPALRSRLGRMLQGEGPGLKTAVACNGSEVSADVILDLLTDSASTTLPGPIPRLR